MDESFLTKKIQKLKERLNKIIQNQGLSRKELAIEGGRRLFAWDLMENQFEEDDPIFYQCSQIKCNPNNLNNRVLSSLSIAYASIFAAENFKDNHEFKDLEIAFEFLMNATYKLGEAKGYRYEAGISYLEDKDRKKIIGSSGGKAKNKPKQELKDWALQQAKSLKMPDRDAARQLSARIPAHLADASKNPEQLIYRALLARHQAK